MKELTITGKVIAKLGKQSGTSKNGNVWSKAEIVIETLDQYPKKVKITNIKNAGSFDSIPIDTIGDFNIDITSREYNGKWYTDVLCYSWRMEHPLEEIGRAAAARDTDPFAVPTDPGPDLDF